jgi:hypothetical protein
MCGRGYSPHSSQETERERPGTKYILQNHTSDLCPPNRSYLLMTHSAMNSSMDESIDEVSNLMIHNHLSTVPPAGDQTSNA